MSGLPKALTAADVAREAGVSMGTAAAALRGSTVVKPATAERVLAAAARLGYRSNSAASVLASHRSGNKFGFLEVGILIANFESNQLGELETADLDIFRKEAEMGGWVLDSRMIHHHSELAAVTREWAFRGFDGIILWRVYPEVAQLHFSTDPFSIVATAHNRLRDGFDVVRCSHYFEQARLLQRVWEHGYRRIGMIWRHHAIVTLEDRARLAAMLEFQDRQPPDERTPIIRIAFPDTESDWRADAEVLGNYVQSHRVEAIVSFNITELEELKIAGIKVPSDVGFACLSCDPSQESEIFGTLGEHHASIPMLLGHLARKIRTGERGASPRPMEVVFRCKEFTGKSLPPRA